MGFLCLLWGGSDTGSDSPDGLVSDDNLAPVFNLLADGVELTGIDCVGLASLTLVQLLANASHHAQVVVEGNLDLVGDIQVALTEDVASLTMTEDDPVQAEVLEHDSACLSCVGTVAIE